MADFLFEIVGNFFGSGIESEVAAEIKSVADEDAVAEGKRAEASGRRDVEAFFGRGHFF